MKKSLLLFAIVMPVMIFVGLRLISAPFFSSSHYKSVYDTILSDDYSASINTVIAELLSNNFSASEIIDQLRQQFPILKKIIISYNPAGVGLTIYAHEPLGIINNEYAFTAQQEIFPKNIFSQEVITQIPHVAVMHDNIKDMTGCVAHLLNTLPSDVFDAYAVELIHEHCVCLIDKQQPKFTIISSVVQEKLSHLVSQCSAIKCIMADRKEFDKGTKWIADTRFAHYIVAYKA